jgi:hypothetical protein
MRVCKSTPRLGGARKKELFFWVHTYLSKFFFFFGGGGGGAPPRSGIKTLTFKPLDSQWVLIGMKKGLRERAGVEKSLFWDKGYPHYSPHSKDTPIMDGISFLLTFLVWNASPNLSFRYQFFSGSTEGPLLQVYTLCQYSPNLFLRFRVHNLICETKFCWLFYFSTICKTIYY